MLSVPCRAAQCSQAKISPDAGADADGEVRCGDAMLHRVHLGLLLVWICRERERRKLQCEWLEAESGDVGQVAWCCSA